MKRLPIGKVIYTMRKEMGATQEDLANSVGVSVPAVSRWESSQAYPDITLLPAIARYFNTTIDHLMDYDVDISHEEVMQLMQELSRRFEGEGIVPAVALCEQYLYKYPNNMFLKLRIGSLYFSYLSRATDEAAVEELAHKAIRLLKLAAQSEESQIAYSANYLLSALYSVVGRTDLSEAALAMIPKNPVNPEDMLVPLYIRQQRFAEAKKLLQSNMLSRLQHVSRALESYAAICGKEDRLEMEEALLHLAEKLLEMFKMDPGTCISNDLALARFYARQEKGRQVLYYMEKVGCCLQELSRQSLGEIYRANPLFDHVEVVGAMQSLTYYRSLLLKNFEQDECFDFLRNYPDFMAMMERLGTIWSD